MADDNQAYRTTEEQLHVCWNGMTLEDQLDFTSRLATKLRKDSLNPPSAVHRRINETFNER